MQLVHEYFKDMGVQERFFDRMFKTPSMEISALTEDEIMELVGAGQGDPTVAEWLEAKCPRHLGFGRPATVRESRCENEVIMKARYEAFHNVLGTVRLTPPAFCQRYARTLLCDPNQP